MNIDRSPQDFQRAGPIEAGPGRGVWENAKGWSRRNPRLSRVVWFTLGLALLALLIWAIYPSKQNNRRGLINQGAQPVGIAKAIGGDINVTLNALGTVTPLATATVRPQVGGMLVKLNFTEGQMVQAGDTLAQIDPRPYQAALNQARGQLAKDAATLANAKVDLTRYQSLLAQNAISQSRSPPRLPWCNPPKAWWSPTRPMWKPPASTWAIPISPRRFQAAPAFTWSISAILFRPAKAPASWW